MDAKENFKPYVPAEQRPLEFTPVSVALGLILAVVFGGANAYLGLRVGLTVSASIPAAVISIIYACFSRGNRGDGAFPPAGEKGLVFPAKLY